jgi:translation initiation factor IF-2
VSEGKISRNSVARVYRGKELLVQTKISSLKRFKDDVREVAQGFECGIELEGFQQFQEGDTIESFILQQENP